MTKATLSIVLVAIGGAAQGGVTLKSVDGKGKETVVSLEGNRLRIDELRVLIYDGDRKELISADPGARTYAISTESDMQRMGADMKKQMESSQAEMRKQMATMPPDQRKQMEEALKQMGPAGGGAKPGRAGSRSPPEQVKYEPLGEKKQVAGRSCDLYRVVRGRGRAEQGCFIPWGDGSVKKDELRPFDGLANFMAVMTESLGGSRDVRGEWTRELRQAPGVPALLVDGSGKTKMQLKSIDRGPIDADKFRPPAGYRKSDKGMFGQ